MALPSWFIDALPERLWTPGNYFLPRVGRKIIGTWHFCVGRDAAGRSVRTVERNDREIGHGARDFDFAAHGTDG